MAFFGCLLPYDSGMPVNYSQLVDEAIAFEQAGELQLALDRWYLMIGSFPVTSTSKDGLTVTFSESARREKIQQLEARINKAAGHGKLKRIPVEKRRIDSSATRVYDADGYAWGY